MLDITTTSLRTNGAANARQRLSDLLSSPAEHGDLLLDIMSDRGLRDALLIVATQTGRLADLGEAAEYALGASVGTDRSPGGPITIIAVLAWASGATDYAAALAGSVPATDPAYRMASLVHSLMQVGIPADEWLLKLDNIDVASCLRFRG